MHRGVFCLLVAATAAGLPMSCDEGEPLLPPPPPSAMSWMSALHQRISTILGRPMRPSAGPPPGPAFEEEPSECSWWVARGDCDTNPAFMLETCAVSCAEAAASASAASTAAASAAATAASDKRRAPSSNAASISPSPTGASAHVGSDVTWEPVERPASLEPEPPSVSPPPPAEPAWVSEDGRRVEDGKSHIEQHGGAAWRRQPAAVSVAQTQRQRKVKEAFAHAWLGYKTYAWGKDELEPVSRRGIASYGMGLTLIDSLDTMILMGFEADVSQALRWI